MSINIELNSKEVNNILCLNIIKMLNRRNLIDDVDKKFAVFFKRRWRRRPTLRIENRVFGKPFPLSLNLALFRYTSREDIFFY